MKISSTIRRDLIVAFISIVLSYLALQHQQPINKDGRLYIWGAQALLEHGLWTHFKTGFQAALVLHPWPFYSVAIAMVSSVLHLPPFLAAQVFNAVLMVFVVLGMTRLIAEIDSDPTLFWWMAFVILTSHYFNHYRMEVMRGHGYMAFGVWALVYFIRFLKHDRATEGFSWMICIVCATAFRVEGIVLAVCAPWVVWIAPKRTFWQKSQTFFKSYYLFLGIAWLLMVVLSSKTRQHFLDQYDHTGYLFQHAELAFQALLEQTQHRYLLIKTTLIGDADANIFAAALVLFTYIGWIAQALMMVLGVPYTFFIFHGVCYGKYQLMGPVQLALFTFVLLILATLILHLGLYWFISSRFVLLLALIAMLFIPFGLREMFQAYYTDKQLHWYANQVVIFAACLGLLYNFIAGLIYFGPSKAYVMQSAFWVSHHTPETARILSNDWQFIFYVDHQNAQEYSGNTFLHALKTHPQDEVIAIRLPRKHLQQLKTFENLIGSSPTQVFKNRRGDAVYVFLRNTDKSLK